VRWFHWFYLRKSRTSFSLPSRPGCAPRHFWIPWGSRCHTCQNLLTKLHVIWMVHYSPYYRLGPVPSNEAYVTWLIHMWHDSFICDTNDSYVTWLIHMWHEWFICDMTHSYVTRTKLRTTYRVPSTSQIGHCDPFRNPLEWVRVETETDQAKGILRVCQGETGNPASLGYQLSDFKTL